MRIRWLLGMGVGVLAVGAEPPAPSPAPSPAPAASPDDLYRAGQQLFEEFAPPEIKQQYDFPTQASWDEFFARLQHALDGDSLGDLAASIPEARAALATLRALPGEEAYADWLALRLDDMEAAGGVTGPAGQAGPAVTPRAPAGPPALRAERSIPYYGLWTNRLRDRAPPSGADALMPRLRAAFTAEGVPPELAWLAEVESGLRPGARSPAGAAGLFQFTPAGAHAAGLRTFLPDERTEAVPSARAAARTLRNLYTRFGSWPLALAAYNAGEGRLSRLLASRGTGEFAGVDSALPAETQMYVPKVLALVALRTGVSPDRLPAPRT